MNTRECLENIYFNICALLNWAVDPARVSLLETTDLIDEITAGLELIKSRENTIRNLSITCPKCGKTSYNSGDILNKYCGNCHLWHSELVRVAP
jgi:4-hydroxy-3-methylbut-2-en-1-yl diphosphate synthase IspG/GcpE